ncbi:acyl-CoA synthetase [Thraustotheca clavata]|uniref:Acyl-CoA synthetase n=1 Tax=Thraustotheca clavata TaxID=74557 RepID=A0A1V9ZDH4_9STRA|nr:acyl-CoA synthetase [Thraustotheca clavata]
MTIAPFILRDIYEQNGVLTAPLADGSGSETLSCRVLLSQAACIAQHLPKTPTSIAFVAHRTLDYVRCQWAIWMANHIAIPISPHSIVRERQHILSDSCTSHALLRNADTASMDSFNVPLIKIDDISLEEEPKNLMEYLTKNEVHDAMLLYTSGTTGAPKGVLTTHATLHAQVTDLITSWSLQKSDVVVHFLPLHHIHGIMNNLLAPLCAGAHVECILSASPQIIWQALGRDQDAVTILMAVPSIYMLLLEAFEKIPEPKQNLIQGAKRLRLAISGSMACPVTILERWSALTGQSLLERYGMTECGMALGNPVAGPRHIGYVGQPFPSVQARIGEAGSLEIRGPTLFKAYWNRPKDTAEAWTADGWFKTGDVAEYNEELKSFRILGRASSAGYKLSALEIERVILEHPQIRECAVYGVDDDTWGQIVATVLRPNEEIKAVSDLVPPFSEFLKTNLAKYKIPRIIHVVQASTPSNNVNGIVSDLLTQYSKNTPRKMKLIDGFLAYVLATGILQFVYCMLVGTFPFNSFLSGFISTVGVFVLTVSLRMQINPTNAEAFDSAPRSSERAFADYLFCNLILFLVVMNFMG